MLIPGASIPDLLPGEPSRALSPAATAWLLLRRLLRLCVTTLLGAPFWPIYLILRIFMGRPPSVPTLGRILRAAWLILTARPEPPLTLAMRAGLALDLGFRLSLMGLWGFAWLLDELLYGRALREVRIEAPIFEISAARSGSTQLAHYLEDDPQVVAPSVLQIIAPFLWVWKIAPRFEFLLSRVRLAKLTFDTQPPEHHERHESDALRTDTCEIAFGFSHQLLDIFFSLGPDVMLGDFRYDRVADHARVLWEEDFLGFIDGIARRTLLHARRVPGGERRHLLIKGHFLFAADALAARYPDARFLTMLRLPEKRLQSVLNFHRCQTTVAPCPPIPWPWLVRHALESEIPYCELEMAWFTRESGPRRVVVPFDAYLHDLEGTMRRVYRELLDAELSPHVPRQHAPRVRTNYSVDRSLAQLGVDQEALEQRLAAYRAWCRTGVPPA